MTEVELHLIKQRMASGRLAKAGRRELAFPLPAGYIRQLTLTPPEDGNPPPAPPATPSATPHQAA